jgi:hypothetical protein
VVTSRLRVWFMVEIHIIMGIQMNLREYARIIRGEKIIEIYLESRKSGQYYWKGLISPAKMGKCIVRFYDHFGEPYRDTVIFDDLDDAKIHVRQTLLNQ